eukprot:scaffold158509_cov19-Tisochrysis_lutea.AAC.1
MDHLQQPYNRQPAIQSLCRGMAKKGTACWIAPGSGPLLVVLAASMKVFLSNDAQYHKLNRNSSLRKLIQGCTSAYPTSSLPLYHAAHQCSGHQQHLDKGISRPGAARVSHGTLPGPLCPSGQWMSKDHYVPDH